MVDVISAEDSEIAPVKLAETPGGKTDPAPYLTGTSLNACKKCMHDDSDHGTSEKMPDTLVTLPYKTS